MAVTRSRRLRKKLHLDEFQEIGFSVSWNFKVGTTTDEIDTTVDAFIDKVIDPNGLAFAGGGYLSWEGIICLRKIGHCTDEHRQLVSQWLTNQGLENVQVTELFDVWWD